MKIINPSLSILGILAFSNLASASKEDINLSFQDIVAVHGFTLEEHSLVTDDGYILKIFRIPGRMFLSELTEPGPPVIGAHGIVDSCDGWVINGDLSPAFMLSDAGYDVWLVNTRGNKYSNKHAFLDPKSEKYWDFSWEEVGTYDLPAITEYILN
jgi:lysosomal acid lipase/cholesteryl ester hydrolase